MIAPMEIHLEDDTLNHLSEYGASIERISEAQEAAFLNLVHHPVRRFSKVTPAIDQYFCIPNEVLRHIYLVGGVLDHDELYVLGRRTSDVLTSEIQRTSPPYFIRPASPGSNFCLSFIRFDYGIFSKISSGNLTTPMALTGDDKEWTFFWDADLEYSFVCRSPSSVFAEELFTTDRDLNAEFLDDYLRFVPKGQRHAELFSKFAGMKSPSYRS